MKTSVTSYSFSQLLRAGEIDQIGMIALAKEIGFQGIEFTDLLPPEGVSKESYALTLKEEAARAEMPIVSYTIGANVLAGPDEIERIKWQIDIAALLGAPVLRHDAYFAFPENAPADATFETYFEKTVDAFKQTAAYGKEKGVKICTENHGLICQDSERVKRIIDAVGSDNFGWLVDIGNFLCVDEQPIYAVATAAPYAFHVHAKDFYIVPPDGQGFGTRHNKRLRGSALGHGAVPVTETLTILKNAGYDGFVTVEYEGLEPCVDALKEGVEYLKNTGLF